MFELGTVTSDAPSRSTVAADGLPGEVLPCPLPATLVGEPTPDPEAAEPLFDCCAEEADGRCDICPGDEGTKKRGSIPVQASE